MACDADSRVSVRMFGTLEVATRAGRRGPGDLGGAKPKQLLEILLLERGRAITKDRLADQLWGESLPSAVAATVETYVSVIRRRLRPGPELIGTVPGGYRMDPELVLVDLDEFDRLIQEGLVEDPSQRYVALSAAVAMSGELVLADEPYAEWALPVQRQYADRHLQARVQLAECCLALGGFVEAAGHAEAALRADPLCERACRAEMVARYATGAQSRALGVYGEVRAALAAELGVVPMTETTALHEAVLGRAPIETLLAVSGASRPPIRFARNGKVHLAFQTLGAGPPDIVFVPPMLSNLGATWDEPVYASFLRRLAQMGRLILFDKRGSGLSDPVVDWPPKSERRDDIAAVLDAAGSDRAVLFGVCDGGAMCARFAARYPDRVSGMALFGVPARLLASEDFEWGWSQSFHDAFLDAFEEAWANGAGLEVMNPSIANDARYRALFARMLRLGASPGMARRLREVDRDLDIRPILADIGAPVLVMAREEDPWVRVENSRYLAEHLPVATLLELPGADHEPWLGDAEPVLEAVQAFLDTASTAAGASA